jgi:starch-binding outer membrane protein, SusD/RagB family
MKILHITYWSALCSAVLLFTACKKDYLEIQPTDRISTSALSSDSLVYEAYVTNRYIGTQLTNKEGDGTPPGFGSGF